MSRVRETSLEAFDQWIRRLLANPLKQVGENGKTYGYVLEDASMNNPLMAFRLYFSPRDPEHLYIKGGPSWGISKWVIRALQSLHVGWIIILYRGERREWYASSLTKFIEEGFDHLDEQTNEPQIHLPLSKWDIQLREMQTVL